MSDNNNSNPIVVNLNKPLRPNEVAANAPSCSIPIGHDPEAYIERLQNERIKDITKDITQKTKHTMENKADSKHYLAGGGGFNKHYERKQAPVFSGVLNYFPDAIWLVAKCSKTGNDQHNTGEPLHWAREKSTDESDCLVRHLMQYDQLDDDGILHAAKVAWRALALLQRTLEDRGEAPISPYNKES